jgi:hypothetical protein
VLVVPFLSLSLPTHDAILFALFVSDKVSDKKGKLKNHEKSDKNVMYLFLNICGSTQWWFAVPLNKCHR